MEEVGDHRAYAAAVLARAASPQHFPSLLCDLAPEPHSAQRVQRVRIAQRAQPPAGGPGVRSSPPPGDGRPSKPVMEETERAADLKTRKLGRPVGIALGVLHAGA